MNSYNQCSEINELDLEPIKLKLMHKDSGEGWTREQANAVEAEYRRFLYLMKIYPEEVTAPLMDVDTFWHYHILDTIKYARDCETVFGYFLHHYPYVGMQGDEDLAAQQRMGERMRDLYEKTFGEAYRHRPSRRDDDAHVSAKQGPAFCAAPATAFCAAPSQPARHDLARSTLTAAGTAFCTAPATAFCAAPATAFCAAPSTAFCAAPSKPSKAQARTIALPPGSEVAFCAAPSTAFCAAPSRPSNFAAALSPASTLAFCAAPAQPGRARVLESIQLPRPQPDAAVIA